MPLPKASDFRAKTEEELAKDLGNFSKEIATLPDTKYGRRQSLKKLVARILTVLNERSRAKKAKAPKSVVVEKAGKPKKPAKSKIYRQEPSAKKAGKPSAETKKTEKAPKKQALKAKAAAKAEK